MSNKVKLPKNVAEAIERLREKGISDVDLVSDHANSDSKWKHNPELNDISLDVFIRALYIGYEIEETPEDKVMELFKSYANSLSSDKYQCGYYIGARNAIIQTLDELNIKIEGVNI